MRMRRTTLLCWALVAVSVCSCGSGSKRKPTFPVTGRILFENYPVANATVVLHPVGESGTDAVRPRGKTGPDGSFALTTYVGEDGAPAGEYQVTVELWLSGGGDEGPSNRLAPRYARPETSGLSATVNKEPTQLDTIVLKR